MPFFLRRRYQLLLIGILLFATVSRLYHLSTPKEYIFDEVYHAITAKLILHNDPRAFEWWNPPVEPNTAVDWLHPPLAKYTQALGMAVFGENSFGWRISSVVFGVLVIAATAKLTHLLFNDRRMSLLAASLASSDGLLLVQSRIAMNDIHVTFFTLLTLICYLIYRQHFKKQNRSCWWWLFLTGLSAGLAMGSKWSGIFVLFVVLASESSQFLLHFHQQSLKKVGVYFLFIICLPATIYLFSYWQMFAQGKTLICTGKQVVQGQCYCRQESSWWAKILKLERLEARGGCKRLISHFSELHQQIFWYQTHLTATHTYQSRPLDWFLDLRPVWFYTKNTATTAVNIYTFGNPALFWFGDVAVIVTIGWLIIKRKNSALLLLIFSYLMVWLPWQFSPRIMFFYHYTLAVPFLCILLSYWLMHLWKINWKFLVIAILAIILLCFVVWYPDWVGLPVPMEFAKRIYFALSSWR